MAENHQNQITPPAKKPRLENFSPEDNHSSDSVHLEELADLGDFKIDKVLFNNTNRKTICLKGSFRSRPGVALVLLEQPAFSAEHFDEKGCPYFECSASLKKLLVNDVYGNFQYFPSTELNCIKTTVIYPATELHIKKFAVQNTYIVDETPQLYEDITLPYILQEQFDLQWVYNILERKAETDRIAHEDVDEKIGFTLIPDLKWDGITRDTLYFLGIVRKRGIKSLRDLNADHLPLLKNLYTSGCKAIESKYGIGAQQLRVYLHYQPSFYHLHVHFTYLKHEAPGILTERAHLLAQVISNIELLSDYYQRTTIPFVVKETHGLFGKFEKAGILQRASAVVQNDGKERN